MYEGSALLENQFEWKNSAKVSASTGEVTKTGDKTYKAEGTLTIRDKTQPVTLTFKEEENTVSKGRIKGSTTLKRTDFGVGQGEWADTKAIKDEVLVEFEVTATKK